MYHCLGEDELKRAFYIEMCKLEKWSTRTHQCFIIEFGSDFAFWRDKNALQLTKNNG
jgi:hypothetical protein